MVGRCDIIVPSLIPCNISHLLHPTLDMAAGAGNVDRTLGCAQGDPTPGSDCSRRLHRITLQRSMGLRCSAMGPRAPSVVATAAWGAFHSGTCVPNPKPSFCWLRGLKGQGAEVAIGLEVAYERAYCPLPSFQNCAEAVSPAVCSRLLPPPRIFCKFARPDMGPESSDVEEAISSLKGRNNLSGLCSSASGWPGNLCQILGLWKGQRRRSRAAAKRRSPKPCCGRASPPAQLLVAPGYGQLRLFALLLQGKSPG